MGTMAGILEFNPEIEMGESQQLEFGGSDGLAETDSEAAFNEQEEVALAAELMAVTSEDELDQFLGDLVKKAWRGVKSVSSAVGKVAAPLGGVLKAVAKKALPFVGGALGTLIPIPGVGTAVGTALGSAISGALETELQGLETDERQFEMARRFVRMSGQAARRAAYARPGANPRAVAHTAVIAAARRHFPNMARARPEAVPASMGAPSSGNEGRWVRDGRHVVVVNC